MRDELRSLGLGVADILDFSVSCNPYGPCPDVVAAIRSAPIDRYPDPTGREAREAIAGVLGREADEVVLGNGSSELLSTLAQVLLRRGTAVVVVEPTFCEFRAAAERAGARVHEWRAEPADGFVVDLAAVERRLRETGATVAYLCAPNTPTGASVPIRDVAQFAEANSEATLLLDQSFLSLSERSADASVRLPLNVVCIRSMTKDHAIPGVRVGYLVATPRLVDRVERNRAAWMTSTLAQAAAIAACRSTAFVEESRERVLEDRRRLASELAGLGLVPVSSTTGFLIVRTGESARLRRRLLVGHRILVRDCASFGLPDYIRLAARPERDRERLIAALRKEL